MPVKSKTWRYIGVTVIAVPMLLFGAASYETAPALQTYIKVGDETISASEFNSRLDYELELAANFLGIDVSSAPPEAVATISDRTRLFFIRRLLMLADARRLGLVGTDAEVVETIRGDDRFSVGGSFSRERFDAVVADPQAFMQQLRENITSAKIHTAIVDSEISSDAVIDKLALYSQEEREASLLLVPVDYSVEDVTVTEEFVQEFYSANIAAYTELEQAKFEYVVIDAAAVESQVGQVEESDIVAEIEARAAQAAERQERSLSLIEVATQQEAADLVAQLREGGADFASLAAQHSLDAGSSEVGGDLGFIARDDLEPEIAEQVFAAAVGDVVGPVDGGDSWLLFEVKGQVGASESGYEAQREQVLAELRREEIEFLIEQTAGDLQELAFEVLDDLAAVAGAFELELQTTDWVVNSPVATDERPGPFASNQVMAAAFIPAVVEQGAISDLIALEDGGYVVVYPTEYKPLRIKPFDEVEDEVREDARKVQVAQQLAEDLNLRLREMIQGGDESLFDFSAATRIEVANAGPLPEGVSAQVRDLIFGLQIREGPGGLPSYAGRYLEDEDAFAIVRIDAISHGSVDEDVIERQRAVFQRYESALLLTGYIGEIEQGYEVQVFEIDETLTEQYGG